MNNNIQYWLDTKKAYENNLKYGIGHRKSIIELLNKIDEKINNFNKFKLQTL